MQLAIYKLSLYMTIPPNKIKVMEFNGAVLVRYKIIINKLMIEPINRFSFLGIYVAYSYDKGIENKICKFKNYTELLIRR